MRPNHEGGSLSNVHQIDDRRERKAGFEQQQRQKAVEALRVAAFEFRKLEELEKRRA